MMWGVKPGCEQTSSYYQNSAARGRSLRGLVLGRGAGGAAKIGGHVCSSPRVVCAQGSPGHGQAVACGSLAKNSTGLSPLFSPSAPELRAGALQSWVHSCIHTPPSNRRS